MMKQKISIYLLLIAAIAFSCKEETGTPTGEITAITHVSDMGEITFYWQQPADENFFYTDIQYTVNGKQYSQKVSSIKDSTTITGIPVSTPIDFTFYAVSTEGKYSAPAPYQAAALTPPFLEVASSINIASTLDGEELFNEVVISWTNTTGKRVTIEIGYVNSEGRAATSSITATEGTQRLSLGNLAGGTGKTFTVVAKDANQNTSEARVFTVDVLNTTLMARSAWTFPGYDPTSRYETIGYSSQALNEATTTYPNNGSVLAMLDGEVASFWHAAWSAPNTVYPHWFIIDLGAEATITHVELTRRQGNSGGNKGYQLLTCTETGAANPSDPTTWSWQDQGEFTFDPTTNAAQKARVPARPRAKYLKFYFAESHKGTGNYVMLSEVNAYALDE
jgi:hypothetical protein